MPRFFHPILKLLASSTQRQLLAQLRFLKAENEVLRSRLPRQIRVTPQERARLVRFGRPLGPKIKELITIVSPRTFTRWLSRETQGRAIPPKRIGRPRVLAEIEQLVLRIADETGVGYGRIQGELKKLGISICASTVRNILKRHGRFTGPHRGEGSWDEFIRMHAETLWACDFFSTPVWTLDGLRKFFMIVFIHIKTRRILISPATMNPTAAWVNQQARNFSITRAEQGLAARQILRDHDRKFTWRFDAILESEGMQIIKTPICSPNLNAFAERVIRSVKAECLDHFVLLGEKHLNYVVQEYAEYYNRCRPHSSRGNLPPARAAPLPPVHTPEHTPEHTEPVLCEHRLGGLLKHYFRKAA